MNKTLNQSFSVFSQNLRVKLSPLFRSFQKSSKDPEVVGEDSQEKLALLGSQLREIREKHQIPLERVSALIKIRVNLLEAIESGEISQLPEPVYAYGLIKQYAEVMGVDISYYGDLFSTKTTKETPKSDSRNWSIGQRLRPIHLYLFYLMIIIGAVNGLSFIMNRQLRENSPMIATGSSVQISALTSTPEKGKTSKTPNLIVSQSHQVSGKSGEKVVPIKTPVTSVKNEDNQGKKSVASGSSLSISVTAKEKSWVQIEVDGKVEFEGVLEMGTKQSWTAKETLVFVTGNAGGVLLGVNQEEAKLLGEPGTIKEITLKAQNPPS